MKIKTLELLVDKEVDIRLLIYLECKELRKSDEVLKKYNELQNEAHYLTKQEYKELKQLFNLKEDKKKKLLRRYERSRLEDWLIDTRWETVETLKKYSKIELVNKFCSDLWECHIEEMFDEYERERNYN